MNQAWKNLAIGLFTSQVLIAAIPTLAQEQNLQASEEIALEEQMLRKKLQNYPLDYRFMYNLGVNLYEQERYAEAAALFQQAAATDDDRLKSQALYNKGIVELEQKQYRQTLESWRSALSHHLENTIIAENLKWLEEHLKEQEAEDQQNQPQQDQNPQESDNDQEDSDQSQSDQKKQQNEDNVAEQDQSETENKENESESMADQQEQQEADPSKADEQNASQMADKEGAEKEQGQDAPGSEQTVAEQEEQVLSQEEMEIQDAQKLIRSVEDKIGRYHIPIDRETLRRRQSKNAW